MLKKIVYKIFGTRNQRLLKSYAKIVKTINQLESSMQQLSNEELKTKTLDFKKSVANGVTLESILSEAFAVCREASVRVFKMRHFDVQLLGGIVLHHGKIAEMRTGEGKTLVGTLVTYLNALKQDGVHVVTVNDYLANRDAKEMGKLYNFLGLTVGINLPDMAHEDKRQAYLADITYGTNNEFGFDYLRDNMVFSAQDKVQRGLNFAVVDEVDSILIDEARTPLIISGPAEGSDELYIKLNSLPPKLRRQETEKSEGDFWVDEKNHNVVLSEEGHERVEEILVDMKLLSSDDSLYNAHNISLMHHIVAALKAHYIYLKDQHYVVQNDEIIIVDEFTGRLMSGRRWSDGLHQAVEAKEKVKIQRENQTMASITFQNYFRMYKKLSGMTGTADTEAYEFQQIYNLETIVIPTNKPMVRLDYNDKIYMNLTDKYNAIIEDIKVSHAKGQPVLVGTTSVENSELLSELLTQAKLKHEVLNAKQHAREAEIIFQAGSVGAITVATNMAGRGTDITLGGNPKEYINKIEAEDITDTEKANKIDSVLAKWQEQNKQVISSGGLCVIGTERHESRRIDNQLRGRSGRQGDPGASRFYLSLEDQLLRIFGGERMRGMMQKLGMKQGESIEHKWLSRSIESAQRKVEGHNFDIRKQLLDYDNVSNDQRRVIYQQRDEILASNNLSEIVKSMIQGVIGQVFDSYIPPKSVRDLWDMAGLENVLVNEYLIKQDIITKLDQGIQEEAREDIINLALANYNIKIQDFTKQIAKNVDEFFIDVMNEEQPNLNALDAFCLQNNIPLTNSFTTLDNNIKDVFEQTTKPLAWAQVTNFERGILLQHIDYYWREHLTQLDQLKQGIHLRGYAQKDPKQEFKKEAFNLFSLMLDNIKTAIVKVLMTVQIKDSEDVNIQPEEVVENIQLSRNSLCHCGSGKKYKHCHGKL